MELALYCPVHGYYETQKDNVGRRGDFYTSVSTGELFGQLLAFRFAGWLEEMRTVDGGLQIVEAGAHDGKLAADILGWLRAQRPQLFERLEYFILEPSPHRQEWQRETLKSFAPRVRWCSRFPASPLPRFNGIVFSNELLDAMPVHRYGWDARNKNWFEWGVAVAGEKFVWARIPHPLTRPAVTLSATGGEGRVRGSFENLPPSLLEVLPDGYIIETSPAAENWWREAAGMLQHGKLLAIDYGHTADELFSPARTRGTLRAYHRHHVSDDLLANVGEQDLTAHVNFSAIQSVGEAAGLTTENFLTQPQFLTQILGAAMQDKSFGEPVASQRAGSPKSDGGGSEDGWNARRTRQFQTLTHPEHLGRAFRVLVQSR